MSFLHLLQVLQACIVNCGSPFHAEIGKFRFLNEMIKLVSPKFAGQHTAADIKSRVIELLHCWSIDITEEPKIAEAYAMLKKQGVVKVCSAGLSFFCSLLLIDQFNSYIFIPSIFILLYTFSLSYNLKL